MALVTEVTGEIIAVNIPEVVALWEFSIRNILSIFVGLLELLRLGQCTLKVLISLDTEFLLVTGLFFDLSVLLIIFLIVRLHLSQRNWLLAFLVIFGISFLIFTNISFPSEISLIDGGNKQICFIRWLVLKMQIVLPFTRSLGGCLLFRFWLNSNISHCLWGLSLNMFRFNSIVLYNLIILDFASVESLGFFNLVVFFSGSMEALHLVVDH